MAANKTTNRDALEGRDERTVGTDTDERTVGVKEQLGAGVIALGIFALLMPWASASIADVVKGSNSYAILSGSILVLGLFIVAAGIAIIVQKFDD